MYSAAFLTQIRAEVKRNGLLAGAAGIGDLPCELSDHLTERFARGGFRELRIRGTNDPSRVDVEKRLQIAPRAEIRRNPSVGSPRHAPLSTWYRKHRGFARSWRRHRHLSKQEFARRRALGETEAQGANSATVGRADAAGDG